MAEVEVARACDLGTNDNQYTILTHLGKKLFPGDSVLGYDVAHFNGGDIDDYKEKNPNIPDVVLVKKVRVRKRKKKKKKKEKAKVVSNIAEMAESNGNKDDVADEEHETNSNKSVKTLAKDRPAAGLIVTDRDQLEYNEFIAELEDSDEDLLADAMESVSLVATKEDDGKGRNT